MKTEHVRFDGCCGFDGTYRLIETLVYTDSKTYAMWENEEHGDGMCCPVTVLKSDEWRVIGSTYYDSLEDALEYILD